jgi:hypothetical protein
MLFSNNLCPRGQLKRLTANPFLISNCNGTRIPYRSKSNWIESPALGNRSLQSTFILKAQWKQERVFIKRSRSRACASESMPVLNSLESETQQPVVMVYVPWDSTESQAGPMGRLGKCWTWFCDGELWTPNSAVSGARPPPSAIWWPFECARSKGYTGSFLRSFHKERKSRKGCLIDDPQF